jgi:hypothetical protein
MKCKYFHLEYEKFHGHNREWPKTKIERAYRLLPSFIGAHKSAWYDWSTHTRSSAVFSTLINLAIVCVSGPIKRTSNCVPCKASVSERSEFMTRAGHPSFSGSVEHHSPPVPASSEKHSLRIHRLCNLAVLSICKSNGIETASLHQSSFQRGNKQHRAHLLRCHRRRPTFQETMSIPPVY